LKINRSESFNQYKPYIIVYVVDSYRASFPARNHLYLYSYTSKAFSFLQIQSVVCMYSTHDSIAYFNATLYKLRCVQLI